MEEDSKVVMKALVNENGEMASNGLLIEDARFYSRSFTKLLYSHTKRDGNKIAHILPRFAVNIPNCAESMEGCSITCLLYTPS